MNLIQRIPQGENETLDEAKLSDFIQREEES